MKSDTLGAENLLGKGDMLYLPFGKNKPIRLQGAWTNPELIRRVTEWLRTQGAPDFLHEISPEVGTSPDKEPSGDKPPATRWPVIANILTGAEGHRASLLKFPFEIFQCLETK